MDFYLHIKIEEITIIKKEKVFIVLEGCDDETEFPMDLTKEEVEIVKRISGKSKEKSAYSCMPILNLFTGEEAVELIREYESEDEEGE